MSIEVKVIDLNALAQEAGHLFIESILNSDDMTYAAEAAVQGNEAFEALTDDEQLAVHEFLMEALNSGLASMAEMRTRQLAVARILQAKHGEYKLPKEQKQ